MFKQQKFSHKRCNTKTRQGETLTICPLMQFFIAYCNRRDSETSWLDSTDHARGNLSCLVLLFNWFFALPEERPRKRQLSSSQVTPDLSQWMLGKYSILQGELANGWYKVMTLSHSQDDAKQKSCMDKLACLPGCWAWMLHSVTPPFLVGLSDPTRPRIRWICGM